MYRLDENTTVIKRMIRLIRKFDQEADIVVVDGFMREMIEKELKNDNITFVYNPFYAVTNSIASLWFAKEHLNADNIVLIDGDIVMEEKLIKEIVCQYVDKPYVLLDSSINSTGDYNVEVSGDKVLVMSKELKSYYGEYAGITKMDKETAVLMQNEMEDMIEEGFYDQWYENALVQLIFKDNLNLYYEDINMYEWTEVDEVSDLIVAKNIQMKH